MSGHLRTWSPACGAVWESCGTSRRLTVAGESVSLGWALELYSLVPFPVHSLLLGC